jgi:hypothetical protein
LKDNPRFNVVAKSWSNQVSENDLINFIDITSRSTFTLCPRGYGRNSFRLYEAMQLGSIPVYIYDEDWRSFKEEINWDDFSVSIHYSQLQNIESILDSITENKIKQMSENLVKFYNEFFSLESTSKKILQQI